MKNIFLKNFKNFNKIIIVFLITIVLFIMYFLYDNNESVTKCNQTFALCPAAKCTPDPLNTNNAYCFCKVQKGPNYSYGNKTCDEISPFNGVNGEKFIYSTYSPVIASLGFEETLCPAKATNLNCMNKICSINPHNPKEAICVCSITNNNGKQWNTWKKKNAETSCNYLSGGSLIQHHTMKAFLEKEKMQS